MVAGELAVTFGVTEPNAGTDTSWITTMAVRQGDKYIVNGQKVWNSPRTARGEVSAAVPHRDERRERRAGGLGDVDADGGPEGPAGDHQEDRKLGRNAVD